MADLFDQVSASPAQPTGDIFDAVAKSTGPASVPYPANRFRDFFDQAEEEAGELYNSALAKAQSVNDVLAYPSEQVYQQLTHPSPGVNIENRPGVKTVSGLVAGAVDPRNLPFTLMGQPEVGPAVRVGAGGFLAGTQALAARQNLKRGEFGQAAFNAALGTLGAAGALHEGAGALLNREAAQAAEGATTNAELPNVAGTGEATKTEPEAATPQAESGTGNDQGLHSDNSQTAQGELRPAPKVFMVPTDQIQVDPNRFQFRVTPGKASVEGAQEFNPDLAGTVHLWHDPETDENFIVNGHHRLYLAKRTGTPEVQAQFINAESAQNARATGALINIAEGTASPIDAAKFFRDTGATPEQLAQTGLSLSGSVASKGLALSKLSPAIFDQVVRGQMSEGRGAAIGQAVGDPIQQKALVDLLAQEERHGKRLTDSQVSELGRFVTSAGESTQTQDTLFGPEEIRQSNAIPKAKLSSYILDRLAKQRLFGTVAKRATDLEQAGNVIDVENSARMAQDAAQIRELYNKLSTSAGPVSDALNDGAEQLAKGAPKAQVEDAIYNRVVAAIRPTLDQMRTEPAAEMQPALSLGSAAPGDLDQTTGLSGLAKTMQPASQPSLPAEAFEGLSETETPAQAISKLDTLRGKISDAWDSLKSAYNAKPEAGGIHGAVDRFGGQINKARFAAFKFRNAILAAVPDKLAREGITNWIQAGGDETLLKSRLASAPDQYKPGYQAALDLTDAQRTVARNIEGYFQEKLQQGQKEGLLRDGLEGYVNQAWAKAPANAEARIRQTYGGKLSTNFSNAKARVFGSYAEGERAGWVPLTKDVADLIPLYDQSFTRALASRQLVRWLASGVASDNRPLVVKLGGRSTLPETGTPETVGSTLLGNRLKRSEPEPLPMLANPDLRPEAARDYTALDHPALKGWSWAATAPDGQQILVKGDLALHPEIAQKMERILDQRGLGYGDTVPAKLARAYQHLSSQVKGSIFAFSPFHLVNEASMGLANRVSPFNLAAVDIGEPVTSELLDHGLQLGTEAMREGLSAQGAPWIEKIPIAGPLQRKFQDFLFSPDGFISRLKVKTAKALTERNAAMYPELDRDQVLKLSATQANDMYGGLAYDSMFRSKSFQDGLRMVLLAPDFTEGRLRFNLSAFGKYGGAARQAIAFDFGTRYIAARALNMAINGSPMYNLPFGVKIGDKTFDMRSNAGDDLRALQSLLNVTGGAGSPTWLAYRINPLLRAGEEAFLTHRDAYGRPMSTAQGIVKGVESAIPISLQGLAGIGRDPSLAESVGTAAGVHDYVYRSPAATILHDAALSTVPPQAFTHQSPMGKAVQLIRNGDLQGVRQMIANGQISPLDASRALREGRESPLVNDAKRVPVAALANAYKAATPDERQILWPILRSRSARAEQRMPQGQASQLKQLVAGAVQGKPRGAVNVALRSLAGVQ